MAFDTSFEGGVIPATRPTIILGGRTGLLGTVQGVMAVAALGPFHAIDLDLRRAWMAPSSPQIQSMAERETIRIRSVWLPGSLHGPLLEQRAQRLDEFLRQSRDARGLRQLVIPKLHQQPDGVNVSHLARELTRRTGGVVRLALSVQAESLVRQADYLDRITSIRRTVEEWDMDIALDLTGSVSPRWESEAAVAKLLPRLTLLRIEPWLNRDGTPDRSPKGQLAARTVAMLADQGYTGIISLYPFSPWPLNRWSHPSVAAYAELLYHDAMKRYVRVSTGTSIISPTEIHHPSKDRP